MEAIQKKYPEIKIIGTAGPAPDGENFDYLWPKMKELKVDLVDEHYYRSPEWFLENAERYDSYDRNGPKVFAGEYAAHPKSRDNNVAGAIAEAAFMTGLERNADVVHLATYAPLFAHFDAWQWKPDMIWFDNLNVVRTPNYYVQQMYAQNVGTNVLSITQGGNIISGQDQLYASACIDKNTSEIIVKVVNASSEIQDITISLESLKGAVKNDEVQITCLHSNVPEAVNTLEAPNNIIPTNTFINTNKNNFQLKALGNAFYICKLKIQP